MPEEYRAEDLTGQAFGLIDDTPMAIRVRFGADIAHLIRERIWHPSQTLEERRDGSVVLGLEVAGEKEVLSWLYSFLPHVEVLEPASLREAFLQGLRACLNTSGQ